VDLLLKKLSGWSHTPVRRKSVVYAGEFENNAGDIEVVKATMLDCKHFWDNFGIRF